MPDCGVFNTRNWRLWWTRLNIAVEEYDRVEENEYKPWMPGVDSYQDEW